MSFYTTYELIDLVRDDGIKTFNAREIATGRTVLVHLFTRPQSPEMQALLGMLQKLSDSARAQILSQGDHEGTPYVVTVPITAYPNFREWLVNERRAPQPAPTPGVQAAPTVHPAPAVQPPAPGPLQSDDPFASLFKKPAASAPPPAPIQAATEDFRHLIETPATKKPVTPPDQPPPESHPDATLIMSASDFQRAFKSQREQPPPAPPAPAPPSPAAPSKDEPGEFTRMFQAPAAPPPVPTREDPGEFTRMFQTLPMPVQPAPAMEIPKAPAPPASPSSDGGEFTRMFQTLPMPVQPAPVVKISKAPAPATLPSSDGGEFTRMFQTQPMPSQPAPVTETPKAPPPPAPADPGEFTRMFNSPPPQAAPQQPAGPLPAFPAAPPTPKGDQPGEFTRMFESPLRPAPLPPSQGAARSIRGPFEYAPAAGRPTRRVHAHVRSERYAGSAPAGSSAAHHAATAIGWQCRRDERVPIAPISARSTGRLRRGTVRRAQFVH